MLGQRPPVWATFAIMWDETGERVTLSLNKQNTPQQNSSVWEVMVIRVRFAWGWHPDMKEKPQCLDVACPPLPLLTTNAQWIYYALRDHPLMKDINEFRGFLFSIAKIAVELDHGDDHAANARCHAQMMQDAKDGFSNSNHTPTPLHEGENLKIYCSWALAAI